MVGGIIPTDDAKKLVEMGVKKVFIPGTPMKEIVKIIEEVSRKR